MTRQVGKGEQGLFWFLVALALIGAAVVFIFMFMYLRPLQKDLNATSATPPTLTPAQQTQLEKWLPICSYITYALVAVWVILLLIFTIGRYKILEFDLPTLFALVVVGLQAYVLYDANKQAKAIDLTNVSGATTVSSCIGLRTNLHYLIFLIIALLALSLLIAIMYGLTKNKIQPHDKKHAKKGEELQVTTVADVPPPVIIASPVPVGLPPV